MNKNKIPYRAKNKKIKEKENKEQKQIKINHKQHTNVQNEAK